MLITVEDIKEMSDDKPKQEEPPKPIECVSCKKMLDCDIEPKILRGCIKYEPR